MRWTPLYTVLLAGLCLGIFGFTLIFTPEQIAFYQQVAPVSLDNLWWLIPPGLFSILGMAALLTLWLVSAGVYARITGHPLNHALHLDALTYWPLLILLLPGARYIPAWQEVAGSTLVVLMTGLCASVAVVWLKLEYWLPRTSFSLPRNRQQHFPYFLTLLLAGGSFMLYTQVGERVIEQSGPNGDEPHYLLMTHSLWQDHDLAMANNYQQQAYRAFFPNELQPHFSIGKDGTRYPGHPSGLAFLLVPAYALNGYRGCVLMMNGLTALLVTHIALLIFTVTQRRWLTLLLTGLMAVSTPLWLYSSRIYPEIPSALLLIVAYRAMTTAAPFRRRHALIGGATLAVLPWIQQRMIAPTLLLLGYYLFRLWENRDRLRRKRWHRACLMFPGGAVLLSGLLMAGLYHVWYGNPLPNAPYLSVGIGSVFSWGTLLKQGLLGLFFDQEAGLFIYAPYSLFFFPGLALLWRARPRQTLWLVAFILSIYVPCAGFTLKWQGAWSPAARYMVALLPFLLVPLAIGVSQAVNGIYRYLFLLGAGLSLFWSWIFYRSPTLAIMKAKGVNALFEQSAFSLQLHRYFPSFVMDFSANGWVTALWLALVIGFSWGALRLARRSRLSFSTTTPQQLATHVRSLRVLGGLLIIVGFLLTGMAAYSGKPLSPRLEKNQRIRQFLFHFDRFMWSDEGRMLELPPGLENLWLQYLSREKHGVVNQYGPRFIVTGPGEAFPQGRYTAYFKVWSAATTSKERILSLEVAGRQGTQIFSQRSLYRKDFTSQEEYTLFPLEFELPGTVTDLETRVYFHNVADVRVAKIFIAPDTAHGLYLSGMRAMRQGQPDTARRLFQQALQRSEHELAAYQLGRLAQNDGNWQQAVNYFQCASTWNPDFADAWYQLGYSHEQMGNLDKAVTHCEHAVHLLPSHLDSWKILKRIYSQYGRVEDANHAEQIMNTLYAPEHPAAIHFGEQLLLRGYSIQNSGAETLQIDLYWKVVSPLSRDYAFFLHFTRWFRTIFQHDDMIATRRWQVGELIHKRYILSAPPGRFTPVLGVWEPLYTQQPLPVREGFGSWWLMPRTTLALPEVSLR